MDVLEQNNLGLGRKDDDSDAMMTLCNVAELPQRNGSSASETCVLEPVS